MLMTSLPASSARQLRIGEQRPDLVRLHADEHDGAGAAGLAVVAGGAHAVLLACSALTTSARRSVAKICDGSSCPERRSPRTMASPIVPHPSTVSVSVLPSMTRRTIAQVAKRRDLRAASMAAPDLADRQGPLRHLLHRPPHGHHQGARPLPQVGRDAGGSTSRTGRGRTSRSRSTPRASRRATRRATRTSARRTFSTPRSSPS